MSLNHEEKEEILSISAKGYPDNESLRLISLGKWAQEHAIPALKTAHEMACTCCDSSDSVKEHCEKALSSIPKGPQ